MMATWLAATTHRKTKPPSSASNTSAESKRCSCGTVTAAEQKTVRTTMKCAGTVEDERRVWLKAQREYASWANQPLPPHYIKNIVYLGKKFQRFIGRQGRCLDVGCGNGLIAGRSYKDVGYSYLKKGVVVGLDPLTLQGPKQVWLNEYVMGVCEHLNFKDESFDSVVFATTLDHVENVDLSLQECKRVLKRNGTLNIWLTCVLRAVGKYVAHPNRFTESTLEDALTRNGFAVTTKYVEPFIGVSRGNFAVSSGNTVFIKASKRGEKT
jgi:SAM-dependent methyltransferase